MRVCVLLGAIVLGVLAVPATARASDSSGPAQLPQQVDAAAAIADAQALVSQLVASTSSAVSAAPAAAPPSASAITATVKTEATATMTETLAAAGMSPASGETASPQPQPASPAPPHGPPARAERRMRHRRAHSRPAGRTAVTKSSLRVTSVAVAVARQRVTQHDRNGATRQGGTGEVSHRPPPLPLPLANPGASALAAGQGTPGLPLVGALVALLLVIFFELLSRMLPRSAFRKPRRLALPPWHPG